MRLGDLMTSEAPAESADAWEIWEMMDALEISLPCSGGVSTADARPDKRLPKSKHHSSSSMLWKSLKHLNRGIPHTFHEKTSGQVTGTIFFALQVLKAHRIQGVILSKAIRVVAGDALIGFPKHAMHGFLGQPAFVGG